MLKRQKRTVLPVKVSDATEWTDYRGVIELFGLKRGLAYHLIHNNLIKSVSLRKPGEKRGKRLFNVASIRRYLDGVAAKGGPR